MKRLIAVVSLLLALMAPASAQFSPPGIISLGDFQIGAPAQQTTPANLQQGLPGGQNAMPGLTAVSCQARFMYAAGGTTVNVFIQTSLDQGTSWFDIANIEFTTIGAVETINLSGLNSVTTPTAPLSLGLANNTTFNGPLGDRLQAVVVSTGNYSGGTLASVRCSPR